MKKLFKIFWKYRFFVLIFTVVGFLVGFFITEFVVNNNFSFYELTVESDSHPVIYYNDDRFNEIFSDIDDYNKNLTSGQKKISYAVIDYSKMIKKTRIEENGDRTYTLKIPKKYFLTSFKTSNGEINDGSRRCENYFKLIFSYIPEATIISNPTVMIVGAFNSYYVGLTTSLCMFVVAMAFLLVVNKSRNPYLLEDIHDNELIFKYPFNKKYFRLAFNEFSTVKKLCGIATMFAIMFACKAIKVPSGFAGLGIGITYLIFSTIGMVYGPIVGIVIGLLSDTLGYFIFPSGGPFFPGYMINAMLSGFMYGLCFYRTKITFTKCLYARLFVNLIVNVLLGSLWMGILYNWSMEAVFNYMLIISLPKNLVYLLPQSIILYIFLKAVARAFFAMGLIDERVADHISLI